MTFDDNLIDGRRIVGIGVDIVANHRIGALIERRPKALDRIFTRGELTYAAKFTGNAQIGRLAARFAAKEAVSKALGVSVFSLGFLNIETLNSQLGKPTVTLLRNALECAQENGICAVMVSISHEIDTSIAFAVALARN